MEVDRVFDFQGLRPVSTSLSFDSSESKSLSRLLSIV